EVFGNNGSTPRSSSATSSSNHSLDELTNSMPGSATVYADIQLTGSGSTFTGTDHYPIVSDYNIVSPAPLPPVLIHQRFSTNANSQIKLPSSSATTGCGIEASTNLVFWTNVGSGLTDTNGLLLFQDTNPSHFPNRVYRAYWPSP